MEFVNYAARGNKGFIRITPESGQVNIGKYAFTILRTGVDGYSDKKRIEF